MRLFIIAMATVMVGYTLCIMVVFTMYILDEALIYCLELFGMAYEHVYSQRIFHALHLGSNFCMELGRLGPFTLSVVRK